METDGPRVARFIETFCTLGGSWQGQRFDLLPFQRNVLDDIYALRNQRRKHRTYLLGLPRKNGKSILGAAVGLYHLIADDADDAPQVISAAGDRQQARLVFDEAARMVRANKDLSAACTVYRNEIRCHRNSGVYRVVSADAGLQQGLNPSMVIFDELHVFKTADLYEAVTLGSATRSQPLTLVISTAGFDLDSPLGRLYQYGRRVESGEEDDTSFGMTWFGPHDDEDFDPADPAVWERFNPAYATLLNHEEFESAYRTTHESAFIRYRLNGWTHAESAWLPHGSWELLAAPLRTLTDGEQIVVGFDGAWKGDSTALVAVALNDFHIDVLGHWEAPIGDTHWRTPISEVEDAIRYACKRFAVREIVADPYRWEQTLQLLADDGLPIVEFPTNSLARMIPATQQFYDAVRDATLTHSGNAALARHMTNAVLKEDAKGGRITKQYRSSTRHIDLAVAAVIAHQRARLWRDDPPGRDPQMLIL